MKYYQNKYFYFCCGGCMSVAGKAKDEREALAMARKTAKVNGWVWRHPHWELLCSACRKETA